MPGRFHESVFGVYFDDLDMFGILHNARYLLLFERAVGEFWKYLGWRSMLDGNPDQYQLVRANHVDYHRPVVGIGEVRVRLSVLRLGNSSLTFGFRVMPMDEDVDYCTGERVLVRIDPQSRRPTTWSPGFRERIRPYLAAATTETA